MAKASKTFVEGLFAYRGALQAFFYRRLRTKADAADLVQEVYLRMLRVSDPEAIRNPEAYLFTVAGKSAQGERGGGSPPRARGGGRGSGADAGTDVGTGI